MSLDYNISNNSVNIHFEVIADYLCINDDFSFDRYDNEGLWDFDVVEVFISRSLNNLPYLELQVSPIGQKFALFIDEPRKKTRKVIDITVDIATELTTYGFKASFSIPKNLIPGDSNEIFANFFACLGDKEERSYFAFNVNNGTNPDYHLPKLFKKIGEFSL